MKHTELAELILDESGYTAMWQADKSPRRQSRLENLKELIRVMEEFETLGGFLEHVALVMDNDDGRRRRARLADDPARAPRAWSSTRCSCRAGRKACSRTSARSTRAALAGLEEERRLAYVGITRAKLTSKISFAQNRRNRGLFSAAVPSRFIDELPERNVEVVEAKSPFGGAYQNFGGSTAAAGSAAATATRATARAASTRPSPRLSDRPMTPPAGSAHSSNGRKRARRSRRA